MAKKQQIEEKESVTQEAAKLESLTKEELETLCELKTRYAAKEKLTEAEADLMVELMKRPNEDYIGITCVRCRKITYIPLSGIWSGCGFCRKTPLTTIEVNELALLLTRSMALRVLEPEQASRMGVLRDAATESKLKIENQSCTKCHKLYVMVEGTTYVGCHHCAGRLR